MELGVRVADDDPSDDGARDDDDVDHRWYGVRHSVVALPNDCSGHELENSSLDESAPESSGTRPKLSSVPVYQRAHRWHRGLSMTRQSSGTSRVMTNRTPATTCKTHVSRDQCAKVSAT